jgi:site-specific DNA-methyltransferase (adenine-specific)
MNLLPFNEMNRLHLGDCVAGMRGLPGGCIPLTVTSPPWDRMRKFGSHPFEFEAVAQELWRVTAPGGVVVWVTQDQITNGSMSGTRSRQFLFFKSLGFSAHDEIVMRSQGRPVTAVRYGNGLQTALVLSRGRPRTVNLLRDKQNTSAGRVQRGRRQGAWGVRGNVWDCLVTGWAKTRDRYACAHDGIMPEQMAADLIVSWSRPGDLVFDPFAGSGTTAKMALLSDRRYLGFEVHEPYFEIAERRLADARAAYRRRLDEWLAAGHRPTRSAPKFQVIYADPPWAFKPWGTHPDGRNAADHYPTMTPAEIASLPVADVAADDSVLLLWATGPSLDRAVGVMEAWGFKYLTVGFTWGKTDASGEPAMGLGYTTRSGSEFCLLGKRGRGLPRMREDVKQLLFAPVTRHSEKPTEVRRRIEALYGPATRLELFARSTAPGWVCLGNEIDGRDIRAALADPLGETVPRRLPCSA